MDIMIPLEFIQILACPICKGGLNQSEDGSSLDCKSCNRAYPIVDGIPLLLPGQTDTGPQTGGEAS